LYVSTLINRIEHYKYDGTVYLFNYLIIIKLYNSLGYLSRIIYTLILLIF